MIDSNRLKNMKRIIFLDIDGVLNSGRWFAKTGGEPDADGYGVSFDPVAVDCLGRILSETGAEIVISSSWKWLGLDTMRNMWKDRNLPGKVIDITPDKISDGLLLSLDLEGFDVAKLKGFEIAEWLSLHDKDVSQYVIIDDEDCVLPSQREHLILTDPYLGITDKIARKIILYFSIM